MGLLSGRLRTRLLVVGTPPGTSHGDNTQLLVARFNMVDLSTKTSTPAPERHHGRLSQSDADGCQWASVYEAPGLYEPDRHNDTQGEVRGCLSFYNTQTSAVTVPPSKGD